MCESKKVVDVCFAFGHFCMLCVPQPFLGSKEREVVLGTGTALGKGEQVGQCRAALTRTKGEKVGQCRTDLTGEGEKSWAAQEQDCANRSKEQAGQCRTVPGPASRAKRKNRAVHEQYRADCRRRTHWAVEDCASNTDGKSDG